MNYHVSILGLGFLGANLAKEFSRYLAFYKSGKDRISLCLVDNGCASEEDTASQPYLQEDIGWNKAAVLSEAILATISGPSRLSICGLDINAARDERFLDANADINIICDCTGDMSVRHALNRIMQKKDNNLLVLSCTDAINAYRDHIPEPKRHPGHNEMDAYFLLTQLVSVLAHARVQDAPIPLFEPKGRNISLEEGRQYLFVCIGTGGTGGNFIKQMMPVMKRNGNCTFLLIDGDRVEERNLARQPYGMDCIMQNKADMLREGILQDIPDLKGRIFSIPRYIESAEDISQCITTVPNYEGMCPVMIGGVDNHRARQAMEGFFSRLKDGIYLDSGNEFDYGEVVSAIKRGGQVLSPSRAHYFPDVMTDDSPSASELSCGIINQSSPQHQLTNLYAAGLLVHYAKQILEEDGILGGILYFDVFTSMVVVQETSDRKGGMLG